MSKGLGKLVLGFAVAGAAAAGVYYYLNRKDEDIDNDSDDEFDDFDDEEDNDDFDDDCNCKRGYVNIDHSDSSCCNKDAKKDDSIPVNNCSTEKSADETSAKAPDKSEKFFDDEDPEV